MQKMAVVDRNLIHFVPVKAAAGYLTSYADSEFIDELNTFTLPMLTGGQFRAFEIIGDSMLPTPSGSIIVGEKIDSVDEVKNGAAYIVVSKNEGIVYKRIQKNSKAKNKLTLESDNPSYHPYQINTEDIMELWHAQVVIGKVVNQQRWDVHSLANLVNNLQDQVSTLKKKLN
jgi:phage repressor protein C with HTH and peptisase S24 domain